MYPLDSIDGYEIDDDNNPQNAYNNNMYMHNQMN